MKLVQYFSIIICALVASCDTRKSISDSEVIGQLFSRYKEITLKEDYDSAYSFIYPDVFDEVSKENAVDGIRQGMHTANYDIRINEIGNDSLFAIEEYGSSKYTLLVAKVKATFFIKKLPAPDSIPLEVYFNGFCERLKIAPLIQKVTCNAAKRTIDVEQVTRNYFILDPKYKKWYMLSDSDPESLEKFIPEEVRNKLNTD